MIRLSAPKSYVASVSVLAVLASITTISGFVLSSYPSHAETSSVLASVTVPDVCTLSADSSSTAHTATVEVGTYTQGIGETILNVLCNDNNGYSIYAVGYSNNTEGNTNLIGSTGNIPTGTANDGSVSNWAMKLTPVTGTFTPTILNDYDQYHTVPSTATKVATRTASIDVSAVSTIKTTYAVALSPAQTRDTYNGKVKYTVVHPNYTNADGTRETVNVPVNFAGQGVSSVTFTANGYPTRTVSTSGGTASLAIAVQYTMTATFTSGYELESWALNNSNYGILGSTTTNPTTFTPSTNSASAVITITGQKQIINLGYMQDFTSSTCSQATDDNYVATDKRDEQIYSVRYINGACWMTRNIAIGCNGTGSTYGSAMSPKSLTSSDSNISATSWPTPTLSIDRNDNTTNCTTDSTSGCGSYTDARMKCSSTYGAWYNYVTVTAGTITGNSNNTVDTYNICPAGWTLPSYDTNSPAGSINSVFNYKDDFSPVFGGSYGGGGYHSNTNMGYWWTTTAYNATNRYSLYYIGKQLSVVNGFYRTSALNARCIKL